MDKLIDEVINAHGGMNAWQSFNHVSIHLKVEGHIWKIKGTVGVFSDGMFAGDLHQQRSGYRSLLPPFTQSTFEPGKLILQSPELSQPKVFLEPRKSFLNQPLETQWEDFQPHYFGNYAWWTYFTSPFNFQLPGYQLKELDPWQQDGETWSRLEVTFPDYVETHCKVQIFYYDKNYLLKRHDYAPEILRGIPSSQYVWDYKVFDGIHMPVTRKIYLRNDNGGFNPEPVMVSLDIIDVAFSK